MWAGVGKSGSPAPKPMTSRPAAFIALAFASTASVADSAIAAIRAETRGRAGTAGPVGLEGAVMARIVAPAQCGWRGHLRRRGLRAGADATFDPAEAARLH